MTVITFNNLTRADGSALIEQDNNIIQASVFGPVDIAQSKMNYEEAVVDILFKPKVSIPSTSPAFDHVREVEDLLRCIFKEVILTRLHPRTSISILVQEISNGGSSQVSCIINAVCCALIDAGMPLRSPVAGVHVKLEDCETSTFDFVYDKDLQMVTILTRGCISEDNLKKAIEIGKTQAKQDFENIRAKVRERFTC